jgi:hypothetical protein
VYEFYCRCKILKFFKRIFDFILFSNIYVALGAVCLVQSSIIQLQLNSSLIAYCFLVFFSTLFVYNFQRVFYKAPENSALNSVRRIWIFKNPHLLKTLTGIGFCGSVVAFLFNDFRIAIYLLPLLVLALLYFVPAVKLRKNPWIKLLTLAIVWTMVTAVLPLLLKQGPFDTYALLHTLVRFWFMIAICIPFDIRDLKIDTADAVSTIPLRVGENRAKWLAFGCMVVYVLLIILEHLFGMINLKIFIALLFTATLNSMLVLMSSSKRSEYFYIAGIDGTMILQGVILLVTAYL